MVGARIQGVPGAFQKENKVGDIRHEIAKDIIFVHSCLDDAGLSTSEFRVYCHLARRAGGGDAFPSAESIAETCKMNKDTAWRALKTLGERRMIRKAQRVGMSNIYSLTLPEEWMGLAECEGWRKRGGDPYIPPGGGGKEGVGGGGKEGALRESTEGNPLKGIQSLLSPSGDRKEKAQELVDLWNENAKESGTFPRARMTPAREGIFATRLKDKQWADDFVTALDWITNAPAAAHYRGDNDRQWVADLDFMLQNGKATSLAEKATATPQAPPEPATPATPQAEVPKWKKDRIAMRQLELENAKREITKLVAQGLSRATCPFRFEDAERGVRKAQEALDAELGGPGAESAATGLES